MPATWQPMVTGKLHIACYARGSGYAGSHTHTHTHTWAELSAGFLSTSFCCCCCFYVYLCSPDKSCAFAINSIVWFLFLWLCFLFFCHNIQGTRFVKFLLCLVVFLGCFFTYACFIYVCICLLFNRCSSVVCSFVFLFCSLHEV